MAKSDGNVPVRLLKDLTGFGKQGMVHDYHVCHQADMQSGSIIPVPRGEMLFYEVVES